MKIKRLCLILQIFEDNSWENVEVNATTDMLLFNVEKQDEESEKHLAALNVHWFEEYEGYGMFL